MYIQNWICISTPCWKFRRLMQSRISCCFLFFFRLFRSFVSILLPMPKVWNYFELCSSTIALFPLDTSVSNWVICVCDDCVTRNCVESCSILMCNYWTATDINKYVRELTIPPGTRELTRNEIHWLSNDYRLSSKWQANISLVSIFYFLIHIPRVNEKCAKLWKTLALETKISKPKFRYAFLFEYKLCVRQFNFTIRWFAVV